MGIPPAQGVPTGPSPGATDRRRATVRRATAALLAAALVLVAGTAPSGATVASRAEDRPDDRSTDRRPADDGRRPERPPSELQARFRSLTGIRTAVPTLLTGVFVNEGDVARPARFTLEDLPPGVRPTAVLPSPQAPHDGLAWSCPDTTCTLIDSAGAPATVAPDDGLSALVALSVPDGTDTDATVRVRVDDRDPVEVPLSRPDGAPALGNTAIITALAVPRAVTIGAATTGEARVTNVAAVPAPAGATALTLTADAPAGITVTADGPSWRCDGTTCTLLDELPAFTPSPPLTVTVTAPTGITGGTGTLRSRATAGLGGTTATATAEAALDVAPLRASGISPRLAIQPISTPAPGSVTARATITATGQGTLSDPVSFTFDLPDGITADWGGASSDGPWTCSDDGCRSTGPLTAGQPTIVEVPLDVAADTPYETTRVSMVATVGAGEGARRHEPARASLTVVPPTVAELRTELVAAPDADLAEEAVAGGSVRFHTGGPRRLSLVVTNHGSAPAAAGTEVDVTASPDRDERIESLDAGSWRCDPAGAATVGRRDPLRCRITLDRELPPEGTLTIPLTLAPVDRPAAVDWTVTTGGPGAVEDGAPWRTRVETVVDAAQLSADVVPGSPLYRGGTGEVLVVTSNRGSRPARGAVAVLTVPARAEVVGVDAPDWSCVDAAVTGMAGTLTCATDALVAPGTNGPRITVEVAPVGRVDRLEFTSWARATEQYRASVLPARTTTIPVAGTLEVDAGRDLTVLTPHTAADGTTAPAVVTLTGDADLASAADLRWVQLCTTAGQRGCGRTVSPTVEWLGVPAGSTPTTRTARFTAPTVTAPEELFFRLEGRVGSRVIGDDVTVRLVPAASSALAAPTGGATGGGSGAAAGSGDDTGPQSLGDPTSATTTPPPPPTAAVGTGASVLQVPTLATGQLVGTGTGSGQLTYAWTQTSGPTATITGATASQPVLQFTAPKLDPDQDDEDLSFELTVTDATGRTATATADVQVVWGDDGLQVTLAGGATDVVGSTGGPVTITSAVSSRGAPYTYDWSVEDLTLPSGTATDAATLAFTAGTEPASGTATLEVTDSFGRQTEVSVPVVVSGLPPGQLPTAFCASVAALAAGRPAQLSGDGVQATVASATLSGAPATPCSASTLAAFTGATVTLPGPVTLTGASGQLSVAGIRIDTGTVAVPSNWSVTAPALGATGLFAPFVSDTAVSVPQGEVTATGAALLPLDGWTGTTTVTFSATPTPVADVAASSTGPATGAALSLTGTAGPAGTSLQLSGRGLSGIGPVDLPVTGTVAAAPSGPAVVTATASLAAPAALGAGTTLTAATLAWTPTSASGPVGLSVGTGTQPVVLSGQAVVDGSGTSWSFPAGGSSWSPVPGTSVGLSGSGSVRAGRLALSLSSTPAAAIAVGADLSLDGLTVGLQGDCPLTGGCTPTLTVTASAAGPVLSAPVAVSATGTAGAATLALVGRDATVAVAPLQVTGSTLSVALGTGAPVATASGTASVLGSARTATVSFSSASTLVSVPLGPWTIATGWSVPTVTALATSRAVPWSPTSGPLAGTAQTLLVPGRLTGVGTTEVPAALADGVLPDDATTALASFVVAEAPTEYLLDVPLADPWSVAGSDTDALSLTLSTLQLTVTPTTAGTTVGVGGTGTLRTATVTGGGDSSEAVAVTTGNLVVDGSAGHLTATLVPTDGAWTAPFGVDGLQVADTSVSVSVTGGSGAATLTGATTLPPALAGPIGVPATATPTLTATFGEGGTDCAAIDLASGGATGVDFGAAGLVAAASADLVIAPNGCTTAGVTVDDGMTLVLDGGYLGIDDPDAANSVSLTVDPTTFASSDRITGVSATIAGLALTDLTITVDTTGGGTDIGVSGTAPVDGTPLSFTGQVVPPVLAGTQGTITLTATPRSLGLGDAEVTDPVVTVSGVSVIGANTSTATVTGTLELLGQAPPVTLTGSLTAGAISQLTGTLAPTTYPLPVGGPATDAVAATFAVDYDATASPETTITDPTAVLTTTTQRFSGRIDVTSPEELEVTAQVPVIADTNPTVQVAGTYVAAGSSAGTYTFTNASTVPATIGGIPQAVTASFGRAADGPGAATESAEQTSRLTMGVFDGPTPITVSGALSTVDPSSSAELTSPTTLPRVRFRGLEGTLQLDITPSTSTGTDLYEVGTTLRTVPSSCDLWASAPVLTGLVYRKNPITYFTLSGTATPYLPLGITIEDVSNQPIVLTNEVVPGSLIPNDSISLNLPVSSETWSADAMMAFGLADCSYSLGGSVTLVFGGGEDATELAQSFTPPAGLSTSSNDLFGPSGTVPVNIQLQRGLLQAEAVVMNRRAAAQAAWRQAEPQLAEARAAQQDLDRATAQASAAQARLDRAQQSLTDAQTRAASAADDAQFAEEFPLAEAEIGNAAADLATANQQLAAARTEVATAAAGIAPAQAEVTDAEAQVEQANAAAEEAAGPARVAEAQARTAASAKVLELTVDLTYCDTCQNRYSGTIDGELIFFNGLVVEADLTLGWGGGPMTVDLTVGVGWEKQENFSVGPVGAAFQFEVLVSATADETGGTWTDVDLAVEITGQADAYISVWGFTESATIASLDAVGQITFVPSVALSAQVDVEIFGFSFDHTWGNV